MRRGFAEAPHRFSVERVVRLAKKVIPFFTGDGSIEPGFGRPITGDANAQEVAGECGSKIRGGVFVWTER